MHALMACGNLPRDAWIPQATVLPYRHRSRSGHCMQRGRWARQMCRPCHRLLDLPIQHATMPAQPVGWRFESCAWQSAARRRTALRSFDQTPPAGLDHRSHHHRGIRRPAARLTVCARIAYERAHEHSHRESAFQYARILDRRQAIPAAETRRTEARDDAAAHSSVAFLPTPGADVPRAGRHLRRHPCRVCVSGGVRRSACGASRNRRDPGGGEKHAWGASYGVALLRRGDARPP